VVSYDLDCKTGVDPRRVRRPSEPRSGPPDEVEETPVPLADGADEAPKEIVVGEGVEYWSGTHAKWIYTYVERVIRGADGRPVGYDTTAKANANVGRVRRSQHAGAKAVAGPVDPIPQADLFVPPDGIEGQFDGGELVQYSSETKNCWVETHIVRRFEREGKILYDLACKKAVPPQRVRPSPTSFKAGETVLYFSDTAKKWLPAQLVRINRRLSQVDLSIKRDAPLERIRKATMPGASAKRAARPNKAIVSPQARRRDQPGGEDGVSSRAEVRHRDQAGVANGQGQVPAKPDAPVQAETPRSSVFETDEFGRRKRPETLKGDEAREKAPVHEDAWLQNEARCPRRLRRTQAQADPEGRARSRGRRKRDRNEGEERQGRRAKALHGEVVAAITGIEVPDVEVDGMGAKSKGGEKLRDKKSKKDKEDERGGPKGGGSKKVQDSKNKKGRKRDASVQEPEGMVKETKSKRRGVEHRRVREDATTPDFARGSQVGGNAEEGARRLELDKAPEAELRPRSRRRVDRSGRAAQLRPRSELRRSRSSAVVSKKRRLKKRSRTGSHDGGSPRRERRSGADHYRAGGRGR